MENLLRKRLALIKNRAQELRERYSQRRTVPHGDHRPRPLAEAAPGEERVLGSEPFYLVRTEHEAISDDVFVAADRLRAMAQRTLWPLTSLIEEPGPETARRVRGEEVCFFDIETTGLVPNTYVFLCGFMYLRGGSLVIDQVLARDYSEELGVLLFLREMLQRFPQLITYNGACFDVPFVRTRMAVGRIDPVESFDHLDLYEPAKKKFNDLLPDCKLATIERHLRGVGRHNDIAGAEIPVVYHDFVRTGNARRIERVLYHNRMDLLAMAFLLSDLADRRY